MQPTDGVSFSNNGATRGLSILGATGSIGTQTLDIVRLFPDRLRVHALTAHRNAALLAQQALEFKPDCVALAEESGLALLKDALAGTGIRVLSGTAGLCEAAVLPETDIVMAAVVGVAGLDPVIAAIRAEKTIALANKETLVVGGALVKNLLRETGSTFIPVDSEHSAIFQCLVGEPEHTVEALTLTASGGPFRSRPAETFASITRAEALRHPNWAMGAKITIDSATMMNKGLEVIEAHWLFDIDAAQIEVLVHPQSIIHSMVTFSDGSTKAQLGVPDMKVPIQYALSYPDRWPAPHPRIDWAQLKTLDFETPDQSKFPCLRLAYEALTYGGTAPAILNAANEQAVALFLDDQIRFVDIPRCVEIALEKLASTVKPTYAMLVDADAEARHLVLEHGRGVPD